MSRIEWLAHGPLPLFVSAAAILFAGGELLRRRSRSRGMPEDRGDASMVELLVAASSACEAAKREGMPISAIAERAAAGATAWFAQSIANIVPVFRRNGTGAFEPIEANAEIGNEMQSLYIRGRHLAAYLRWARTVQ